MVSTYAYKAFGLNINSYYRLIGPLPGDGQIDIEIIDDGTIDETEINHFPGSYYCVNEENIVLHVEDIGKFTISGGNKIKVKQNKATNPELISIYILGSCFGALLLQRGMIPIHGSALVENGKCFIVTGDSGAGKSTLSAALRKSGSMFMADDISAVRFVDSEEIEVLPAYPQQKLWKDTVEAIIGENSTLTKIGGNRDKYYYPVNNHFYSSPLKLSAIFEIKLYDSEDVICNELSGIEKLNTLICNTFRTKFVNNRTFSKDFFMMYGDIAKRIPIFRIYRPAHKYTVDELVSYIKISLNKL